MNRDEVITADMARHMSPEELIKWVNKDRKRHGRGLGNVHGGFYTERVDVDPLIERYKTSLGFLSDRSYPRVRLPIDVRFE